MPSKNTERYWLTRFLFLRSLGFIYFLGFLGYLQQFSGLLGEGGLYPIGVFLDRVRESLSGAALFWKLPSLLLLGHSDTAIYWIAGSGLVLSLLVLSGFANAPILFGLWVLYMSLVRTGQLFYGYGWEMMLLEAGFLAIFLAPPLDPRPFPKKDPAPETVMWLYRWMIFRVMFGAGMIKIRGDACWRDLTCLVHHYETQPIPNPISWYLHHLPLWFHKLGVVFNHFVELIVPFFVFGPGRLRWVAGALIIVFQSILIVSGNLSWLNYLTIFLCIPCFDDRFFERLVPKRFAKFVPMSNPRIKPSVSRRYTVNALAAVVIMLSYNPVANMLSTRQAMNASFDPFGIVNTYGAFGSVGKVRREVVLEGTYDQVPSDKASWIEVEFKCKPGRVGRAPCWMSPYHYRIDWQIWFAAMQNYQSNPWLVHFVHKLLRGDAKAHELIEGDPFDGKPPRFIRASLYEYRFSKPGSKDWWERKRLGLYLPPLSLENPSLRRFLETRGWH